MTPGATSWKRRPPQGGGQAADLEWREQAAQMAVALEAARMRVWQVDVSRYGLAGAERPPVENRGVVGKRAMLMEAFVEAVHPEDRSQVKEKIRLAVEEGREFHCEFRIRYGGGVLRRVSVRAQAVHDTYGFPSALVGMEMDVTERKQVEEDLARKTRQLEVLCRACQQLNTVLETEVILETLVRAALDLVEASHGYVGWLVDGRIRVQQRLTRSDAEPVDFSFGPGEGVAGWVLSRVEPYLSNDTEHDPHVQTEYVRRLRIYNLANVPLLNRLGELIGCLEVHNLADQRPVEPGDVFMLEALAAGAAVALENARVLAEQQRVDGALRESESRNRALLQAMPDGVFLQSREGVFLDCHIPADGGFGWSASDLQGKRTQDWLPEPVATSYNGLIQEALRTGETQSLEYKLEVGDRVRFYDARITSLGAERVLSVVRDITARERVEEALRQSEERYRAIHQSNPVGIATVGLEDTRFQSVNPAFCRMLGFTEHELLRMSLREVCVSDDAEAEQRFWNAVRVEGSRGTSTERRFRTKSGQFVWGQFTASAVCDPSGTALFAVCMVEDVTERRRTEQILRLQGTALESAANGIIITDRHGIVVWSNAAFTKLTGYGFEEVRGQDLRLLKAGRQSPEFYQEMWHTITNGRVWHGLLTNRRKDGSLYEEEQTITPVLDRDGNIGYFIAIKQDVTERSRMEMELRQSRDRFRRIFELNPAGIGISTLGEGRFLEVNESFLEIFGFTRGEVIGQTSLDLELWVVADQRKLFYDTLRQNGVVRNFQASFRNKRGGQHTVFLSAETVDLGLEPSILFIALDITDQMALEEQLRQTQKMEAIGQLASGVAHDFNNILTVIQGHTNLARMHEQVPRQVSDNLAEVAAAAERAANLTRQLLTFSRKQPMELIPLDLNEVVTNLTKMMRRIIGETIALEFKYSPSLPRVQADTGMMEQVLLNLAVNARDAMPDGGRLIIGTEVETVDASRSQRQASARPGQFVCLSVQDSGVGIAPEVLPRIFEPFFTTKEVGKGTGLGLATVDGIVQQHQGWVEVSSQQGVGTTFRVYIPATPKPAKDEPQRLPQPQVRGGTEVILLVEDEAPVRDLTRQVLEKFGYTVLEAFSGVSALKIWQERAVEIDLLLSDIVMPGGMSGRQLAERLRQEKPSLKVILTTGYNPESAEAESRMSERVRLLRKPFPPHAVATLVREVLDEPIFPTPPRSAPRDAGFRSQGYFSGQPQNPGTRKN